jgi:hypothetical protein
MSQPVAPLAERPNVRRNDLQFARALEAGVADPPAQLDGSELLAAVRVLATSTLLTGDAGSLATLRSRTRATRAYTPVRAVGLDAWLLWWSPEGEIDLHDHGGASGAIYVLEGRLLETHATRSGGRLRLRTLEAGGSIAFGPDHVHDIINPGPEPALSLHAYGPRLETMTYYRVDARSGRLVPDRSERVEPAAATSE